MSSRWRRVEGSGKRLVWLCWLSFVAFLLLAESFHRFVRETAWRLRDLFSP